MRRRRRRNFILPKHGNVHPSDITDLKVNGKKVKADIKTLPGGTPPHAELRDVR